jgi:hypothetical protein
MPSFSPWYALDIRLRPGDRDAHGAIIAVRQIAVSADLSFSQVQTFDMPRADYLELTRRLASLTDGWAGSSDELCFDGTPVAFELTRNDHVTSGVGNADCDHHYAVVRQVIVTRLFWVAPNPGVPVSAAREAKG